MQCRRGIRLGYLTVICPGQDKGPFSRAPMIILHYLYSTFTSKYWASVQFTSSRGGRVAVRLFGIANFRGCACVKNFVQNVNRGMYWKHVCLHCSWRAELCNVFVSCLCHIKSHFDCSHHSYSYVCWVDFNIALYKCCLPRILCV